MKNQQVNVDFWAMGKAMLIYLGMTAIGWVMLRLINTVLMLPRTMRSQGENLQNTLNELQRRYPDMNITEEDLKNAEKELEEILKEDEKPAITNGGEETEPCEDNKKNK